MPGKYSTVIRSHSVITCEDCEPGSYSVQTGATTWFDCIFCPPGTYAKTATTATMCLDCPAGTDSAQFLGINISVCDDCGAGTYASATIATSVCIDCVAGKYSTTQGATSASVYQNCPSGTTSVQPGISVCVDCVAGKYASSDTAYLECTLCASGKYSETIGAGSENYCLSCFAGTFSDQMGADNPLLCLACTPGLFSQAGSSECANCPENTPFLQDLNFVLGVHQENIRRAGGHTLQKAVYPVTQTRFPTQVVYHGASFVRLGNTIRLKDSVCVTYAWLAHTHYYEPGGVWTARLTRFQPNSELAMPQPVWSVWPESTPVRRPYLVCPKPSNLRQTGPKKR